MAPSSTYQALVLATLAFRVSSTPLAQEADPCPGQAIGVVGCPPLPIPGAIAQIFWYALPDCQNGDGGNLVYNVPPRSSYDPDTCDPGLPPYTDGNGNEQDLPFNPASFQVVATTGTCDPDLDGGQQLESVILWSSCGRQYDSQDNSFYCPAPPDCTIEGWSLSDNGYNSCVNTPQFADTSNIPYAFSIEQRTAFCNSSG